MLAHASFARLGALLLIAISASAQRVVNEWGEANSSSWLYIAQSNTIEIYAADANTFSFETYDQSSGEPLDFDLITVVGSVSGTVKVEIAPDPNSSREFGAATVRGIDLLNATTGELAGLKISGDVGSLTGVSVDNVTGAVSVDGNLWSGFVAGNATAPITIDGHVLGTIGITTVSAPITIGGSVQSSTIDVGTLSAALTIDQDLDEFSNLVIGTATANVSILGNLNGILAADTLGNLTLQSPLSQDGGHFGQVRIANDYAGTMTIYYPYNGLITLDGDLTGVINGNQLGNRDSSNNEEGGTVTVKGDVNGGRIAFTEVIAADEPEDPVLSIDVQGSIRGSRGEALISVGTLRNTVAVRGTLFHASTGAAEIVIGSFEAGDYYRGAVAIDYDANGLDTPTPGQDDAAWRNFAKVKVGTTSYLRDQGNSNTVRVWNVRDCKGPPEKPRSTIGRYA